jgi:hypothetical protein
LSAAAELVFDRATKRYPGREKPAVDALSLRIPAGEIAVAQRRLAAYLGRQQHSGR